METTPVRVVTRMSPPTIVTADRPPPGHERIDHPLWGEVWVPVEWLDALDPPRELMLPEFPPAVRDRLGRFVRLFGDELGPEDAAGWEDSLRRGPTPWWHLATLDTLADGLERFARPRGEAGSDARDVLRALLGCVTAADPYAAAGTLGRERVAEIVAWATSAGVRRTEGLRRRRYRRLLQPRPPAGPVRVPFAALRAPRGTVPGVDAREMLDAADLVIGRDAGSGREHVVARRHPLRPAAAARPRRVLVVELDTVPEELDWLIVTTAGIRGDLHAAPAPPVAPTGARGSGQGAGSAAEAAVARGVARCPYCGHRSAALVGDPPALVLDPDGGRGRPCRHAAVLTAGLSIGTTDGTDVHPPGNQLWVWVRGQGLLTPDQPTPLMVEAESVASDIPAVPPRRLAAGYAADGGTSGDRASERPASGVIPVRGSPGGAALFDGCGLYSLRPAALVAELTLMAGGPAAPPSDRGAGPEPAPAGRWRRPRPPPSRPADAGWAVTAWVKEEMCCRC